MEPTLGVCLNMFNANSRLLEKALDGLTEEEAWKHPGDSNPLYWVVGHMAVYRHLLAKALGAGDELPWAGPFKRTTQPDEHAGGPTLAEMHAALSDACGKLTARFSELSQADLEAPAPLKLPTPDPTVRGMVGFFAYHETYHLGQVAYIKKWLGHPGIVDGQ